jgi:hypothetical protein
MLLTTKVRLMMRIRILGAPLSLDDNSTQERSEVDATRADVPQRRAVFCQRISTVVIRKYS